LADTTVVDAVGWKHVRNTYAKLTEKLEKTDAVKETKLKAIDYWTARLQEDRFEIDHERQPRHAPPEQD